jgi:hypothetical protein
LQGRNLGTGGLMLLERERERLLAILQSRTSTHAERKRARMTLDGELSPADWPGGLLSSGNNSSAASGREPVTPRAKKR